MTPASDVADACFLSIVVPAYNEIACLEEVVAATAEVARGLDRTFEIIIVDDGSSDGTRELAERLASESPEIRCCSHAERSGSGMAIRSGIAASRGTFVMYVPADGQFHLPEIADFVAATADADIVIGARLERSDYSAFRLATSKVFTFMVNRLFDQDYRDVNWVHLWRREIFGHVESRSRGVFFLEETLVRATELGYTIVEIDSRYKPRAGGVAKGASASSIAITLRDMLGFWLGVGEPDRATPALTAARWSARYLIAGAMIPVGLALGAGSLVTKARKRRLR